MQFKHPEILYALFALLIPIIVHLFQLRKFQTEKFTNVAFLKQVNLQTRKSAIIKKWLVLLTRLLLLAAAIFAFAQPYTSKTNNFTTKTETVIYLDNSFSLQAKGTQGELFKRAIQDIITEVPKDQNISIITNNQSFKNTSIKAIKNDLLQLDYAANQLNYDAVLLKSKTLFSKNTNSIKNLIFVSDFQEKENRFQLKTDSLINVHAVALKPVNTNNISIDSVYISNTSATNVDISVRLKNTGIAIDNIPVSLLNNGNLIAKTAVALQGETITNFTLPSNTSINGEITIEDTQLQFDNSLFFNINKAAKINVLSIDNTNATYLKRIFTESEFHYTSTKLNQLNYSVFDKQNLIILNELKEIPNALSTALNAFTSNGGFLIVIPNEDITLSSYNNLLVQYKLAYNAKNASEKKITTINYSHPLYTNVFDKRVANFQYPKVNSYYTFQTENASKILQFEDAKPFLTNNKNVFVFASALNSKLSNFTNSPLIVPTFYNIAKYSLQVPNLYYTIGKENKYDVAVTLKQDGILSLVKDEISTIPQQQYFNNKVSIVTNETPNEAGIYSINNKTEHIENVSYNLDRTESNLVYQDISKLKDITTSDSITQLFNTLKSDSKINELWKWFVIFALVFLIIEMLILKYFK
ncbi:BatA domain-containing protein [Lacinutrix sp. C3R15]|uniref:BatA domain-containing protein n=1 Tax=Flavobacteriaceae TaxID=49546 RepID=UPI001C08F258|nr:MULTISPECIES: BatA domain-containing protein [Flavobacteriaceae]MBU2938671.1 BatA domain-containing protein [Lacinutrix sp. C3R15]MDO6621985.1 BatA domain-containing protein [Oceanihabitans sp. 1_MG-2023]